MLWAQMSKKRSRVSPDSLPRSRSGRMRERQEISQIEYPFGCIFPWRIAKKTKRKKGIKGAGLLQNLSKHILFDDIFSFPCFFRISRPLFFNHTRKNLEPSNTYLSRASRVQYIVELLQNEFTKERSDPGRIASKRTKDLEISPQNCLALAGARVSERQTRWYEDESIVFLYYVFRGLCPWCHLYRQICWKVVDNGIVTKSYPSHIEYNIETDASQSRRIRFNIIYIMRRYKRTVKPFWDRDKSEMSHRKDSILWYCQNATAEMKKSTENLQFGMRRLETHTVHM